MEGHLRSLPPPPEGDGSDLLKHRARIRKLLEKHQIELDEDTAKLVDHIVDKGVVARGLDKLLTKDWFITEALTYLKTGRDGSRQRTLEWLAELTGVYVRDPKREASTVADVVIGGLSS